MALRSGDLSGPCGSQGTVALHGVDRPVRKARWRSPPGSCHARAQFACWDGEDILLSPYGTPSLYREAIPHELVHRLADTPRWSYLNDCIEGWRYDRAAFVEAVAHKVGK